MIIILLLMVLWTFGLGGLALALLQPEMFAICRIGLGVMASDTVAAVPWLHLGLVTTPIIGTFLRRRLEK